MWLWPGNELSDFDKFYALFGYTRSHRGSLAVWGHSSSNITHVSQQVQGHLWESKCGADLRIQHSLNEFSGDSFGKVIAYYQCEFPLKPEETGLFNVSGAYPHFPDVADMARLREEAAHLPKRTVAEFEKTFENWRNNWFSGRLAINSNPNSRANCVEYFKLTKMGEKILPLVVLKLTEKENFLALSLYNRLQNQLIPPIEHNLNDPLFFTGEQGRALGAVNRYLNTNNFVTIHQ